ncbi:MAG TPA: VWA domain-containing protein, partial [Terriglobales bacterium]|nr:VWA domain-containing protein [Terriglobales bacterium]
VLRPQMKQSAADSSTVIRATTHLVQLDVVVTDSSGQPVKNALTEKDFTIVEDGQPQKISFFSYQQFDLQEKQKQTPPQLPPHVTTNRPEFRRPTGPPIVLLLDGINTPVENQIVVRQQMLNFLADHFDPRMRIAVFLLGNELSVLQDFTSDPALLTVAMRKYRSQASAAGRQGGTDVQLTAPTFDGPNLPSQAPGQAGAGVGTGGGAELRSLMNISYALARFEKESNASSMEMRIDHTADALSAIARYLSAFPGRKVVIWFSASFPLSLSVVDPEDFDVFRSYADRIRTTTNLLSDAQIAVYTVDARGLAANLIADPSNTGRDASGRMALTVDAHMNANSKETFERFSKQDSLAKVAQETGGRVFLNTNDFDRAIVDSIRDSSNFYEIGYYPTHKQWDGKFHTVKVKVSGNGLSVRHRRGYYAVDPESWRRTGAKEMNFALEKNAVTSTGVLFYARALPPPAPGEVKVEFLVDTHTITFETMAENQHYCNLEFQVQAFNPEGKLVKAEVQQAEAPLKPETFDRIRQNGLPMPVSIKLSPGQYVLHLGVRDNRTGQFGTSELPLTVGEARAP